MNKEELLEAYGDLIGDTELLMADGFDDAIVGICSKSFRIIYDYEVMLEILMEEGMEEIDAIEHLEFNVLNAYVGEQTPIYML